MAAVFSFMESPLVVWVSSFYPGGEVDFVEISDGVFLNDVLTQIDERDLMPELNRSAKDVNGKLQNWEIFNSSLKQFYQEILQQVIIMDLPDILTIVNNPTKEASLAELQKALLLVLGCAVQCNKKEDYINKIKQQSLEVQAAIVDSIKEITENSSNVLSLEPPSEREDDFKVMHNNIKNLVTKRDQNYQALVHVTQERNYWRAEVDKKSGPVSPPTFLEKHHLVRELNKHKDLNSKLSEETEEKSKQLEVMKNDLHEKTEELNKVKMQNFQLVKDARTARSYRDELDMYKEMASKAEKYEKEILKYKETLNEMTFFKSRVEELRDDNTMLCESRTALESQLVTSQKKCDSLMKDLLRAQGQLDDLNAEKVSDQKKIQALLEDLSALEFEKNNMKEGYSGPIRRMISYASAEFLNGSQLQLSLPSGPSGHSISEELSDSMAVKARKTELENQELHLKVEELNSKVTELERELSYSKQKLDLDYKQRMEQLETQAKETKISSQRELEKLYKEKTAQLEEENYALKQKLTNNYNEKVQNIHRRNQDVEAQVKHMEELWRRDKENSIKMEEKCKDLVREKEQLKEKYDNLARNTESMENMIYKDKEKSETLRKQNRDLQREKDVYKQKIDSISRESEDKILQLKQEIEDLTLENDNLRCTCSRSHETENNNHINMDDDGFIKHQGVSCDLDTSNGYDSSRCTTPDIMNLSYSSTVSAPAEFRRATLRTSTPQKQDPRNRAPVAHIAGTPQQNNQHRHSSYHSSPVDSADDLQKMWYTETVNRLSVKTPNSNKKGGYESDSTLEGYNSDTSSQNNDTQSKPGDMQMRHAHSLRRGVVAPIRRGLPLESDYMAQMRASMPVQKLTYVEPPELPEKRRSMSPKRSSTLNRSESLRHHPSKKDKSLSRSDTFHVSPENKTKSKPSFFKGLLGNKSKDSKESNVSQKAEKYISRSSSSQTRSQRQSEREKQLCSKHKDYECSSPRGDHGRYPDEYANQRHGNEYVNQRQCSVSTDSGRASPDSSRHNSSVSSSQTDTESDVAHILTSIKVITTETVKTTQTRLYKLPRNNANWRYMVDRMMELQSRNQKLIVENTEMRRTLNTIKFDGDRLSQLESRNMELVLENKKLNKIILMLQGGRQYKNPNDDKEYHYWTAC